MRGVSPVRKRGSVRGLEPRKWIKLGELYTYRLTSAYFGDRRGYFFILLVKKDKRIREKKEAKVEGHMEAQHPAKHVMSTKNKGKPAFEVWMTDYL